MIKILKIKIRNSAFYILLFSAFYFLFSPIVIAQVQLDTALPNIPGIPSPAEGLVQYINYIFVFGLGFITILSLAVMMYGGILYILAAGNTAKMTEAKEWITQALLGLGLLLVSYLLLRTINPDLVNLTAPKLTLPEFQQGTTQAPPGTTITPGAPGINLINCPGPNGGWQCNSTQFCSPDPFIRCTGL